MSRVPMPHCDGPTCGTFCDCTCATCSLVPTLLGNLRAWSEQLRSAQLRLDLHGGDREQVAVIAGRLLDLSEALERAATKLRGSFAP